MFAESLNLDPELENNQGQSRRFRDVRVTSAYTPRATTKRTWKHFAFVPKNEPAYAGARGARRAEQAAADACEQVSRVR